MRNAILAMTCVFAFATIADAQQRRTVVVQKSYTYVRPAQYSSPYLYSNPGYPTAGYGFVPGYSTGPMYPPYGYNGYGGNPNILPPAAFINPGGYYYPPPPYSYSYSYEYKF